MQKRNWMARLFGRDEIAAAVARPSPVAALSRITGRPMAMSPVGMDALLAAAASPRAYRDDGDWSPEGSRHEHLITVEGNVGVLRIHGPLFQRWDGWAWIFGGAGYDVIGAAFDALLADGNIEAIVLDVDSPGGEVAGCADLADRIYAARGVKPIFASVNDAGYSGAYWLASSADKVAVTRTGGAGSIGVIACHLDVSKWDEKLGFKYTTIAAGDKKNDGDPHAPLSDRARGDIQAEVDRINDLFVEAVARNRGLSADAVRGLQAGWFCGQNAVSAGLVDAVGTMADVMGMVGEAPPPPATAGDAPMPPADDEAVPEEVGAAVPAAAVGAPAAAAPVPVPIPSGTAAAAPPAAAVPAPVEPPTPEARAAALRDAVVAASLPPDVSMALLKRNRLDEDPAFQIAAAQTIRGLCVAAKLPDLAAEFVQHGKSVEVARAELVAVTRDTGPEISTHLPQASLPEKAVQERQQRLNPTNVYRQLNTRK